MQNITGIYRITSPSRKIYIGKGIDVYKTRWRNYKNLRCKGQVRLYNSLIKYGFDAHIFEVIEECLVDILSDRERYYVDLYESTGKNGLNCMKPKSSDRNGEHSKETCDKISKGNKGKIRTEEQRKRYSEATKGEKNAMYGHVFTEEHRDRLRESAKHRLPRKKKIIKQYDLDKNFIQEDNYIYFQEKSFYLSNISKSFKFGEFIKTYKGYYWIIEN